MTMGNFSIQRVIAVTFPGSGVPSATLCGNSSKFFSFLFSERKKTNSVFIQTVIAITFSSIAFAKSDCSVSFGIPRDLGAGYLNKRLSLQLHCAIYILAVQKSPGRPFLADNLNWEGDHKTKFVVMRRDNGRVAAILETHPTFIFHQVNL